MSMFLGRNSSTNDGMFHVTNAPTSLIDISGSSRLPSTLFHSGLPYFTTTFLERSVGVLIQYDALRNYMRYPMTTATQNLINPPNTFWIAVGKGPYGANAICGFGTFGRQRSTVKGMITAGFYSAGTEIRAWLCNSWAVDRRETYQPPTYASWVDIYICTLHPATNGNIIVGGGDINIDGVSLLSNKYLSVDSVSNGVDTFYNTNITNFYLQILNSRGTTGGSLELDNTSVVSTKDGVSATVFGVGTGVASVVLSPLTRYSTNVINLSQYPDNSMIFVKVAYSTYMPMDRSPTFMPMAITSNFFQLISVGFFTPATAVKLENKILRILGYNWNPFQLTTPPPYNSIDIIVVG